MTKTTPRVLLVNRAIVLNSKKQILAIQRSAKDSWGPGKWELPGGKLEEGQDISNALEREVFEETSLVVMPISKISYYSSTILNQSTTTKKQYIGLLYIELVGIAKSQNENVKLSEEHDDYKWLSVDEMLVLDLTETSKKALIVLQSQLEN